MHLSIYRHFFLEDYVIGVKHADDGTRHLMPANAVRGTTLQYLIVWPFLLAILAAWSSEGGSAGRGGGSSSSGELAELLDDAGAFPEGTTSYGEAEVQEDDSGNEPCFGTRKTVDLTAGYSNFPQFDPDSRLESIVDGGEQ